MKCVSKHTAVLCILSYFYRDEFPRDLAMDIVEIFHLLILLKD